MADRELQRGNRGDDVRVAQDLMNRVGALVEDDGNFGAGTEAGVRYSQDLGRLAVTGRVDAATWTWLRAQPEPAPDIATRAVTFIVRSEVGSRAYYDTHTAQPTFPGGASGLTIGIGYDLKYHTREAFAADWGVALDPSGFARLAPWVGLQVTAEIARQLDTIVIPWRISWTVFIARLLPAYVTLTREAFPGFDRLTRLRRGVLVSLVYNRGTNMDGDDRREMREVRDGVADDNLDAVPPAIIAMKRLWPNVEGLRIRRDREAALFTEGGLKVATAS